MPQPFHAGERHVQRLAGERDRAERNARALRTEIVPGAHLFLKEQRQLAVATERPDGALRVSLLTGEPGFARTEDGTTLVITRARLTSPADDAVWQELTPGAPVGTLALEYHSRRRIRINGHVRLLTEETLIVDVEDSVPLCPKYIQRRAWTPAASVGRRDDAADARTSPSPERLAELLARADTAFVGSRHASGRLDVSHRGGAPGFLRLTADHRIRVPDYAGNSMFRTLGNFQLDPSAALAIPDFARGRVLQLTGHARLDFGADDPTLPTGGTGRYWEFEIAEQAESAYTPGMTWELLERSPFNP